MFMILGKVTNKFLNSLMHGPMNINLQINVKAKVTTKLHSVTSWKTVALVATILKTSHNLKLDNGNRMVVRM
jgi:hypothetical protein